MQEAGCPIFEEVVKKERECRALHEAFPSVLCVLVHTVPYYREVYPGEEALLLLVAVTMQHSQYGLLKKFDLALVHSFE